MKLLRCFKTPFPLEQLDNAAMAAYSWSYLAEMGCGGIPSCCTELCVGTGPLASRDVVLAVDRGLDAI